MVSFNNLFFTRIIVKKLDVNDYSFAHFTFVALLHYIVKCPSRSLADYKNVFILGIAQTSVQK